MHRKISFFVIVVSLIIFTSSTIQAKEFRDVNQSHWAYNLIKEYTDKEIITGYPDKTFKPSEEVSRGEFVSLMVKSFNINQIEENNIYIEEHWAKASINKALNQNILKLQDYPDGINPDEPVSREEASRILARIIVSQNEELTKSLDELNSSFLLPFKDHNLLKANQKYIAFVNGIGLIKGYPDRSFRPNEKITRAETVVVLDRALHLSNSQRIDFPKLNEYVSLSNSNNNVELITQIPIIDIKGLRYHYKSKNWTFEIKNIYAFDPFNPDDTYAYFFTGETVEDTKKYLKELRSRSSNGTKLDEETGEWRDYKILHKNEPEFYNLVVEMDIKYPSNNMGAYFLTSNFFVNGHMRPMNQYHVEEFDLVLPKSKKGNIIYWEFSDKEEKSVLVLGKIPKCDPILHIDAKEAGYTLLNQKDDIPYTPGTELDLPYKPSCPEPIIEYTN